MKLHLQGRVEGREYRQEFGSNLAFLYWGEELNDEEVVTYNTYEWWFREAEQTVMSKSYKMVLLQAMLERGTQRWMETISPVEAAPDFHEHLTGKEYGKRIDFSDSETKKLWVFDRDKVGRLIFRMPMIKWSGSSKGRITFEGNSFHIHLDVAQEHEPLVYEWTRQIAEYRLHAYFQRKGN